MGFEFTDRHIEEYHSLGYTIFRDIVPPALLADLRRQTDLGRPIARRLYGANAPRLPAASQHPELDLSVFDELDRLPGLTQALEGIFERDAAVMEHMSKAREYAVLYEPGDSPYCMPWHRDMRDLFPGLDLDKWHQAIHDPRMFNQSNIALYDDACLWAVPGSHSRRDTPAEIRRFPDRPIQQPDVSRMSHEAAEYACRQYAMSMPGAQQIFLNAGDYMIYRNTIWHVGVYVPYVKRATIHGALLTPEYKDFYLQEFLPVFQAAQHKPRKWQNANAGTATYREVWLPMMASRYWRKARRFPRWFGSRAMRKLGLSPSARGRE